MKNVLIIILLLPLFVSSQEIGKKELYIFIDSENITAGNGQYNTYFSLKSKDKRFSHDIFKFQISNFYGEEKTIFNLGRRVGENSIEYIIPQDNFKFKKAHEIHDILSLYSPRYNRKLFIVTKIPGERMVVEYDKEKKYIVFEAMYTGTVKDISFVKLGKNVFLK